MACLISPAAAFGPSARLRPAERALSPLQQLKHAPLHPTSTTDRTLRKSRTAGRTPAQAPHQEQATTSTPSPSAAQARLSWPKFLTALFVSGAVSGPLLDGIHSRAGLQVYEVLPVHLGGLHTSLAVPPLLGAYYVVVGSLFVLLDRWMRGPETTQAQERARSVPYVALAVGVLAADLQLSAYLLSQGTDFTQISLALALASAATWQVFDGTPQGFLLSAFTAAAVPLSELVLLRLVPLWTYPQADWDLGPLGAYVSWEPWCYFFWATILGVWVRYLVQTCRTT